MACASIWALKPRIRDVYKRQGNPRFAYDSYRRFVQMFSDVVMEMNTSEFEKIIDELKEAKGVTQDVERDADDMKALVAKFKSLYKEKMGADFPKMCIRDSGMGVAESVSMSTPMKFSFSVSLCLTPRCV